MKELSIEEKAKRYDEAIEKFDVILNLNTVKESGTISADDVRKILPELKKSEDERIRREILEFFNQFENGELRGVDITSWIDWLEKQGNLMKALQISNARIGELIEKNYYLKEQLEKQGEQKPVEPQQDMLSQEKYAKAVDECIYGEQKTANKVEPKFKVGDKIRKKTPSSFDRDMQVARIEKDYYVCNHIGKFSSEVVPFSKQSSYELVEQNLAWSDEDEQYLLVCKNALAKYQVSDKWDANIISRWLGNRLKSLRPQSKWKPTEEQMEIIDMILTNEAMDDNVANILRELKEQLKTL